MLKGCRKGLLSQQKNFFSIKESPKSLNNRLWRTNAVVKSLKTPTNDLNESRFELLSLIQGLTPELQNWRSKFDTEVKVYCNTPLGLEKNQMINVVLQFRSALQESSRKLRRLLMVGIG
ncbi:hypothetical protein MRB53_009630 [Persea americana]|uniref:Uncharacterized protein n=1 Tax=Persea americana TaxID=3435 RepID=A0ACC2LPP1_PERAE|nr:hypothetical protein MRB53_009630 [Persea americana]